MKFADQYIKRYPIAEPWIQEEPSDKLGMAVVVPVCNEPGLIRILNSLAKSFVPSVDVEVILVVNHSELSSEDIVLQNESTCQKVRHWNAENHPFFCLHLIYAGALPAKHAGVGWARKIGMDEAVRRFNQLDRAEGLIISLDADTLVNRDYFRLIEKAYSRYKGPAITFGFKHRVDELDSQRQREGIELYEKYLHFYRSALEFSTYPYPIYTVGSAFAFQAGAYVKVGGMNRRQAGEDFYFLHKLTQLGKIEHLNQILVYPSARISSRVPFGTGPMLKKWIEGDNSLLYTYNFQAFCDLKVLFDSLEYWWKHQDNSFSGFQSASSVIEFLNCNNWDNTILKVARNSGSFKNFRKRFFQNFSAFQILRFLNDTHEKYYQRQLLVDAIEDLRHYAPELVAKW